MSGSRAPTPRFQALVPGARLPGDWYDGTIPANIVAGVGCVVDSSFCFKEFRARHANALRLGDQVTLWRTSLAVEEDGTLEIGSFCFLANASIVCARRISLGSRVFVAGGVTIVDSDLHPLAPAARLRDTIALSPAGDGGARPQLLAEPVEIADDVWIGYNATILKGVSVGAGAVIAPGAVVTENVAPGARVSGNPARDSNEKTNERARG